MNESSEQYKGKYVSVYMVYAISPDRQEGRSSAYDTLKQAETAVYLLEERGWSAGWEQHHYEVED